MRRTNTTLIKEKPLNNICEREGFIQKLETDMPFKGISMKHPEE